jgi:GNAT superfamily N-acetyltransferase
MQMNSHIEAEQFIIRQATMADAKALAHHRCEMFKDMGQLREEAYQALADASIEYFERAIPAGEYVAWVVAPQTQPDLIVAGGGMQLRRILPRPDRAGGLERPGPQGLILNVYTEKGWRRKGLAELITLTIIEWSRNNDIASLVLHASEMGRSLYEKLGFVTGNEMWFPL